MTYTRYQCRRDAGRGLFRDHPGEPAALADLPVRLRAEVARRVAAACDGLPVPPQRAFLGPPGAYPRLTAFTPRGLGRCEWLARALAALAADDVLAVDVRGDRVDVHYADEWQIVFSYRGDFYGRHE